MGVIEDYQEMLLIERSRARYDLGLYVQAAWDVLEPYTEIKWGTHHDLMCEYLEACEAGQIKRLVINVPPRELKTTITSICFPTQVWTKAPHKQFLFGSYSEDLATSISVKRRNLIESDWYQGGYAQMFKLSGDSNQKSQFTNDKTGAMISAGIMGSVTGKGGDYIIIDDPHNPKGAESPAERTKTLENFDLAWSSRLNDKKTGCIIVIMQRLHKNDLTGHLIAKEQGYEHLVIPSICEQSTQHIFPMSKKKYNRAPGDLLHEERTGKAELDQAKKDLGSYGFAGQHQQMPYMLGGNIIKSSYFKRYQVLPPIRYRIIYADTAQKVKQHNDYSVFECWGVGSNDQLYLMDLIRGKWEAPELKKRAVAFWAKHRALDADKFGALRDMRVEDKSSGTGLIQDIAAEGKIPIKAIQRGTDKLTRVMDVLPYLEMGSVHIPEDAAWVSDFVSECEEFSTDMSHDHDDQIDPMCDAIVDNLGSGNKLKVWERLAE